MENAMSMRFTKGSLSGLVFLEPEVFEDNRGFFLEIYHRAKYRDAGIDHGFVQDNHSRSARGVIRGLHYQTNPAAQGKLVRAIAGTIFDVAVDIRRGSATFGKWCGVELSAANRKMLYIPVGFAHGFAALTDGAEITYKTTNEYSAANDAGVMWDDPDIAIDWPVADPLISEKDARNKMLSQAILM